MKTLILAGFAGLLLSGGVVAADLSPAMSTVMAMHQTEFRGYKPGNKEMRAKLKEMDKIASADEMEAVMKGEKPDWMVVDIRNDKQYNGGHILVDGKPMLHVGRLKPTSILQKEAMEIKDNKEIVKKAPANIIIMCRSGMKSTFEYAAYATAGFNDVKIAGIADWAAACKPLASRTKIEDAGLIKKKITMKQAADGMFYSDQCPQVQ